MTEKIVQYLNEAHATELGLVRVLQSQIAMTPRGEYRQALEQHLRETRGHADRVQRRLTELGGASNPITAGIGLVETMVGQMLALSKAPLDMLRGTSGDEKILKNAKDTCATEALEIATYIALAELAARTGDDATAKLASDILADEERMLTTVSGLLPQLVGNVIDGRFDIKRTGAADTARTTAKRAAKKAGVTEPWPGYDKQTVDEITKRLSTFDESRRASVGRYERTHKNRTTVIEATQREPANT